MTADFSDIATGSAAAIARALSGRLRRTGRLRAEALGIGLEGLGAIAHSVNMFFRSAELATCTTRAGPASIA